MTHNLVQWRYKGSDGAVVNATGFLLADQGETLKVEVFRDGKRSGTIIEIPKGHVTKFADQAAMAEPTVKERFVYQRPSEQQLVKINSFLMNGAPALTADNTVTVPFVAADNLLNRGLDRWDMDSLAAMANLLPGLPCLLDHDWDDTSKEWGRIYSAELVRSRLAPDGALNRAGNFDQNRQIVNKEGFAQVVFEVFTAPDSPVVRALLRGHSGNISTGGFRFTDYVCPTCNTSFSDAECPHIPPYPMWGIYPDEEEGVAPYAIRTGLFDMGEASIVTIPNLPNAGVI